MWVGEDLKVSIGLVLVWAIDTCHNIGPGELHLRT